MDFRPFKIGKYLLLERLATGGMAEVYRAKASGAGGFEKQLAIKRILPNYSQNEEFRRMFEYEARLSSMLTHANIVQVYDFVKSGDTYLLAMEYVDGKNLRQLVNKARKLNTPLPIPFSIYVINEVCKGLEYAHGKKDDVSGKPLNIIHRDMSPQNVMMSYDGAVKIVDFGIAKAKDRVDETRSGVIKGKFGYMSPEQANGVSIDHRSDIFSTGIILFEMITGKRLFSAENDMATLKLIQECVIPMPTRINPKVPAEFEKIVLKALTKDVNLRYQNAGNFHRQLQSFLGKHFSNYTQKDVAETVQMIFRQEIENEKRRLEQLHRQSIPFSQGAQEKINEGWVDEVEVSAGDGEVTKSEKRENTPVTFVDEAASLSEASENEISAAESRAEAAESTRVDESLANGDPTTIESLIVEDESIPTVGTGGATNPSQGSVNPADRTQYEKKTPSGIDIVGVGGGAISKPSATNPSLSVTPRSVSATTGPGTRQAKPPPGPESLILRSDVTNTRQRERSISALTEISGNSNNDSFSLASIKEPGPPTNPGSLRKDSFYAGSERDFEIPRRSRLGRVAFFALLTMGTAYAYRMYLDGSLKRMIAKIATSTDPTGVAPVRDPDTLPDTTPEVTRPKGDCVVEITSDPSGAAILLGGRKVGVTTTTVAGQCNSTLSVELLMDGFEPVKLSVPLKEALQKEYRTLKRSPTGRLELVLNQNVTVYVEGKAVGEARANKVFSVTLRADRPYKIRFINEILGIDVTQEFKVEVDTVSRPAFRLESN